MRLSVPRLAKARMDTFPKSLAPRIGISPPFGHQYASCNQSPWVQRSAKWQLTTPQSVSWKATFLFVTRFGGSYRWGQASSCAYECVQFGTDADVLSEFQLVIANDVLNVRMEKKSCFT